MKHFDQVLFLAELHTVPFNVMDVFEDVDDKLFVFETLFAEVLDDQAPLKRFHVHGYRLWRKFTRTDCNYQLYKAQRNLCTFLRRKATKGFFVKRRRSQKPKGVLEDIPAFFAFSSLRRTGAYAVIGRNWWLSYLWICRKPSIRFQILSYLRN